METRPPNASGRNVALTNLLLAGLTLGFIALAALFTKNLWGHLAPKPEIPLVDKKFLDTTPWRRTYTDLVKAKEDLSDYDCYGCHEKNNPPPIRYDANQKIIIPKEHSDIVMGHGSHDRNNLCYNCHNEQNLATLQVRDGRELKFDNIPPLCGSCHGPTYRDWEAGAHGRTSGYWTGPPAKMKRQICVDCHNPHSPKIPPRKPAPGPHLLHPEDSGAAEASH
jgi:hypothetical protein